MGENQKYIYRLIDREEAETQDSEEREMNTREQSPVEEGETEEIRSTVEGKPRSRKNKFPLRSVSSSRNLYGTLLCCGD